MLCEKCVFHFALQKKNPKPQLCVKDHAAWTQQVLPAGIRRPRMAAPLFPHWATQCSNRGRWEQGNTSLPIPGKTGLRVNTKAHTANLGGRTVMFRGHNCPCRACWHIGAIYPCHCSYGHCASAATADFAGSWEVTMPSSMGWQCPGSYNHGFQEQAASRECANRDVFKANRLLRQSSQEQSDSPAPPTRCYWIYREGIPELTLPKYGQNNL